MKILLTGGHSGIGLELTKLLLNEEHQLGLIVRSEKRKQDTLDTLGERASNIDFFYADLSDQKAVKQVATEVISKWEKLDGLFNNAGMLTDKAYYSPQGNELQFEVNALAPYLLARELKPLLDQSDRPFIVTTSTGNMHKQKAINVPELKKPTKFVKLMGSYFSSKFASLVMMNQLASEWSNVRILAVDPGPNKTKMTSGAGMPAWLLPLRNLFFPPPTKGAKFLYHGAFDEKFVGQSGVYVTNNTIKSLKYKAQKEDMNALLAEIQV